MRVAVTAALTLTLARPRPGPGAGGALRPDRARGARVHHRLAPRPRAHRALRARARGIARGAHPSAPSAPSCAPAPLLHPLHTPHAPHAHPMHPVVRRRSEAILAARVHAVCSSAGSRPSRSMRRRPATRHRTSLRHRPRARHPDPVTPTPSPRARHTEHGPAPPTVYSLRLPCYARRSCMSSRPPRGAGMSCGCASRTARPPNPNPNPNPHPNSSP